MYTTVIVIEQNKAILIMNDIGIRYNSSHFTPCQTNNADQTLTSSTGVKSTPHASRKLPLTEKSPPFIDGLGSKAITTVSSGITITDSKQTMDANDAWEEIESLLQNHIGLSSSHLEKAKQCLNELSATKFQYFEDLADAVITRLNTTEGTNYSLTGEIKTNDHNKSVGKLWEVCKYLTTAFAAQSLLTNLPLTASATNHNPAQYTVRYLADSGMPRLLSLPMPDACRESNKVNLKSLQPGQTICLKDGSKDSRQRYLINHTDVHKSIAITTGYGNGDVKVFADTTNWPDESYPPLSDAAGTYQCAILKNPGAKLTMITIAGNYRDTSMVFDFDVDKCRVPNNMRHILRPILSPTPPVLNDICAGQPWRKAKGELVDGQTICLPNGRKSNHFYIRGNQQLKQLAISTNHGSGDLSLHVGKTSPLGVSQSSPLSAQAGNDECVVYKNEDSQITYVVVKGNKKDASLALDFNSDKCRLPLRPGFTEETRSRTDGYPYKSAHLLVYKLNFSDQPNSWRELENDLERACDYYNKQSYGQFQASWEMVEVHLPESIERYHDRDVGTSFRNRCRQVVIDTGINPYDPGGDNIVMIASPSFTNSKARPGNSFMTIMDHNDNAAAIAHDMAHAMGLNHAGAIDAGNEIIRKMPENDSWYNCRGNITCKIERDKYLVNYGNQFDVMSGDNYLTEMNLLYKSFFGWLDLEKDVPLATESGRYRIHAFDHGDKDNGPIGLRLKSGNGDYTYWLAYRTIHPDKNVDTNGIVINLEGYAESKANDSDDRFWKTTSYLLDMTPDSIVGDYIGNSEKKDFKDSALAVGKSFTDPWGGFTITTNQTGGIADTARAWIEVDVVKEDIS